MHTIEIPDIKFNKKIPAVIEELQRDEFIYFCELLLLYVEKKITAHDFKQRLAFKLLNIKITKDYFKLSKEQQMQVNVNMFQLADLMDSFFEDKIVEGELKRALKINFIRNLIPSYNGLYGPKDALTDVIFREYREAHKSFVEFSINMNIEALNKLIAILYRPKKRFIFFKKLLRKWDGQHRIEFNPNLLEERIKKIAHWPFAVKYGIYLFYAGCEEFLKTGQPLIDGNPVDLSILYNQDEKQQQEEPNGIGLAGILFSLAESNVFGDVEKTDNQNIYDIFLRLYQVVIQNKKLEAEYKKHDKTK